MTNQQHPITPPDELVDQWHVEAVKGFRTNGVYAQDIATQAAQWGADQELEACCELVPGLTNYLRAARRPKPPSLKEQALEALDDAVIRGDCITTSSAVDTIRRALEALDD